MMRLPLSLLLFFSALLGGCVVPYGDVPPNTAVPAPAASAISDLTGLEARVLLLLDDNQDADRAARLEALRALLRRARTWPPQAQKDLVNYLDILLDVEERWRTDEGLEGFHPVVPAVQPGEPLDDEGPGEPLVRPVEQEPLDPPDSGGAGQGPGDQEGPPVTVAPERDAAALRAEAVEGARRALAEGAYEAALDQLAELSPEGDEEVARLWQEAVDGHVHAERERAGGLFLAARSVADSAQRKAKIEEVVGILKGLLERYPESSYAAAIQRNLQLVEQELETLE
ncbi:MAG: hypothetical protein ABIO70_20580 [Pseudomonadota bacterium]